MTMQRTETRCRSEFFKLPMNGAIMLVTFATSLVSMMTATAQTTTAAPTKSVARSVDETASSLRAHALQSLQEGDNAAAIAAADAMVRLAPDDARTTRLAADIYLRSGKAKWAVRLFDRFLETNQDEMPQLWQRGIALYLMGDYQGGIEQFEAHQKVNPHDVENAAWHFLCVAKMHSPDEAKKRVLAAPNDPRIPMQEIRHMLTSGDTAAVTSRVHETPENTEARKVAAFYGDFYLGLYADALGDRQKAQSLLTRAATDAPRNYMGDIARVYAEWLSEGDL